MVRRERVWRGMVGALALAAALSAPLATAPGQSERADDERDARGRRVTSGETTTLAFKNVTVSDLIPFIVETTGKVVVPRRRTRWTWSSSRSSRRGSASSRRAT